VTTFTSHTIRLVIAALATIGMMFLAQGLRFVGSPRSEFYLTMEVGVLASIIIAVSWPVIGRGSVPFRSLAFVFALLAASVLVVCLARELRRYASKSNELDAVNPAFASLLHSEYHRRGVTDPGR
jgi:hypothetical protein